MRIVFVFVIFLPSFAASDSTFARRYPDSGIFFSTVAVEDGYVVAANRKTVERNRFEVLIMKVRPTTGIILWKQIYGSGSDMIGWQLISTVDGGLALLGKRRLSDLSRWDVLLLKLSSTGKLEWAKTYFSYFGDQKGQIVQTRDGGFLIVGPLSAVNVILQRIDRAGNLIWNRALEETFAYSVGLFGIAEGLFVSALEESGQLVLLKFSSGGRIHLKKKFRGVPGSSILSAFLMSDNGFILWGFFSMPDGRDNMFLARLDKNMNVIWTRTFLAEIQKPFGPLIGRLEVTDVNENVDGNILVACKIYFPLKVPETALLEISLSGKILNAGWFGTKDDSTPNLVLPLEEGEILIAGPSFDTPSFGNPSGFLLKLNAAGNFPACDSFQDLTVNALEPPPVESIQDINLYPISPPLFNISVPEIQTNILSIPGETICR